MSLADVLRPTTVGDKPGVHRYPLEPKPQPPIGWAQSIIDSLGDLFIPQRASMASHVSVVPSLPLKYSYMELGRYVVNVLGPKQTSLGDRLTQLDPDDITERQSMLKAMQEVKRMTDQIQAWIAKHKNEHSKETPGRIATINLKLKRTDKLIAIVLKFEQAASSASTMRSAPAGWTPATQQTPGIANETNGCFMNSTLQGIFGDPVCRQYIALATRQHDTVRLCAAQFATASQRKDPSTLVISKTIRALYGLADGRQHDAHEAMMALIGPLSGGKNYALEREAHASGNPIVQKLIRRATYSHTDIDLGTITANDQAYFKGNKQEMERFDWYLPISPTSDPESLAMESLLERALCPAPKDCIRYNFSIEATRKRKEVTAETEVNTFARRPEYLLFNFLRAQYDFQKMRTYRVGDAFDIDHTFYLDGKHVETGQGGQYEVRWFNCHSGSAYSGHYVAYKKVGDKWFYYSDSTVKEASAQEVAGALKTCYLMFAGRVDTDLNDVEISQKVKENVAASKAKALQSAIASAKTPLPKGDSPEKRAEELARIELFCTVLDVKDPEADLLEDLFKAMPETFRAFMTNILLVERKISKEAEVLDHLVDLKTIVTEYLTTGLSDHIVAQYQHIRAQQLALLKQELAANAKQKALLSQSKETEATMTSAQLLLKQEKFKQACYQSLLAKVDAFDEPVLLELADLLSPGLSKLLQGDVRAHLEQLLKHSFEWETSLQQQVEMVRKLLSE